MRSRGWWAVILVGAALLLAQAPLDGGAKYEETEECRAFDAGVLHRKLADRTCATDDDCTVFRPRTMFYEFGCCIPVARKTLDAAQKDPEFVRAFDEGRMACGHINVRCRGYCCEHSLAARASAGQSSRTVART